MAQDAAKEIARQWTGRFVGLRQSIDLEADIRRAITPKLSNEMVELLQQIHSRTYWEVQEQKQPNIYEAYRDAFERHGLVLLKLES